MGAGMAFPWNVIRAADLAHPGIVEDLKLGLDLTAAGHPPFFCPTARVTSQFSTTARGADIQRRRWEQGHIATIIANAPRLLSAAIMRGDFRLLALALDLAVPPLSLLALLLILIFFGTVCTAVLGFGYTALTVSSICLVCFAAAIGLAWRNYGRDVLSPHAILSIPGYIFGKLGLYWGVLRGKIPAHWIGTDRTK
jgi:cellulose synthase/poly-beta-1,6-N-acetylglucosamine synthase-like glycosyltransferase